MGIHRKLALGLASTVLSVMIATSPAIAVWVCGAEQGTKSCTSAQHVVVRSYTKGQTDHWAAGYHTLDQYLPSAAIRYSDSPVAGTATWKASAFLLETTETYPACGSGV